MKLLNRYCLLLATLSFTFLNIFPVKVESCCQTPTNNNTQISGAIENAADPVSILDGVMLLEETDLVVKTPLLDLSFARGWRTPVSGDYVGATALADGWSHSFEWRIRNLGASMNTNTVTIQIVPPVSSVVSNETYQGTNGAYVILDAVVNPMAGRYKGGTYYFIQTYENTTLTDDASADANVVRRVFTVVGRSMQGAMLSYMGDWTWKLSGFAGNGVVYKFNNKGLLSQITHPAGATITIQYNASNRATNITHSCGTALSLTYTGNYLTKVSNNRDANLWVEYSRTNYASGNYSKMFQTRRHISANSASNLDFKYYYKQWNVSTNSYQLICKKETPIGDTYLWNYQTGTPPRAIGSWIVSGGVTNNYGTTFSYRTPTVARTETDILQLRSDGLVITNTYHYDLVHAVPTNIVGPISGQFESRVYDSTNNLTDVYYSENGVGAGWGAAYDYRRNPVALYSSYNSDDMLFLDATLSWNTNRLLSAIRDPLSRGYLFDYTNTLLSSIELVDENDNTMTVAKFGYNTQGLVNSVTNANNHVTSFGHVVNATERVITMQQPLGLSQQVVVDQLWRPKRIVAYDAEGVPHTTGFQTDYAGRPLRITNALGKISTYSYDQAGHLVRAQDAGGYVVTNEWRLGKLVSQSRGNTNHSLYATTSFEYDPQMTTMVVIDPNNRSVESYGLDAAGQITTVTNMEGQTMTIERGALGWINGIERFDGSYVSSLYNGNGLLEILGYPSRTYNYNYTTNGLLSSVSLNNDSVQLEYNQWNRPTNLICCLEGWIYTNNLYTYDSVGNRTGNTLIATDGYSFTNVLIASTYLYDANERLIGENDADGTALWRYTYNLNGSLARATNMIAGIYSTYQYDALGRVTSIVYDKRTRGFIPYYISYSYNDAGQITAKNAFGGGQGGDLLSYYTYDALGRLSYESCILGTNAYNYSSSGQRTSIYLYPGSISYSYYTNSNRLASWGNNGCMTYNDAGCVTSLSRNSRTNIMELNWNGEYQLACAKVGDIGGFEEVTYGYDSLGRKTFRSDNSSYEYYLYDGMNLVADYDANNARITRTYTYGPGIDNIQSMTIYDENGGYETYYYVKDSFNTVHVLVDGNGLIVEYYYYDAFGNFRIKDENYNYINQSVYGNRFLFQGREYDTKTQLYYFRARWYEPETGRWLSKDPIGISGGLNLYAFCENDPVNFVDPMGLWGIQFGDINIGIGNPWLAFDESSVYEIGKGAAATADGLIPYWNPFEDAYTDDCGNVDTIYQNSQLCGNVAYHALSFYMLCPQSSIAGATQTIVHYGSKTGIQSGQWVMTGPPSARNWIMSGASHLPWNYSTSVVPKTALKPPSGWEMVKYPLGQRILKP